MNLRLNMDAGSAGSVTAPAQAPDMAPAAAGDENWDNRFGLPGILDDEVESIAVAANGDIYVAGRFVEAGNIAANQVARWDGSQFHALGEGLSGGTPYAPTACARSTLTNTRYTPTP